MYAALAALPIVFTLVAMIGFSQPAKKVLPLTFLLTFLLSLFFWQTNFVHLLGYTLFGALKAVDIIVIVMGGVLIYNTLKISGALSAISQSFENICPDKRVLLVVVGYLFVQLIEGAAGFGTPAAIAAPILIGLGVPPLAAASFALISDSTAVSYGAVGTPFVGMISVLPRIGESLIEQVNIYTAIMHAISGFLLPAIALGLVIFCFGGANRSLKAWLDMLPFCLFTSVTYLVPYLIFAYTVGYETPALVAAAVSLVIVIPAAKAGFLVPKTAWNLEQTPGDSQKYFQEKFSGAESHTDTQAEPTINRPTIGYLRAWLPYILIIGILIITRIPALPFKAFLRGLSLDFPNILGIAGLNYSFAYAYLPGTVPFILVALVCNAMYQMKGRDIAATWRITFGQTKGAAVALVCGVAMVQLMIKTGNAEIGLDNMIQEIAKVLVYLPYQLYFFAAPFIGVLGAFMSGSSTVSNILFSSLQYEAGLSYQLDPAILLAMQNVGGAIGNMICINNILAVLAVSGLLRNSPQKAASKNKGGEPALEGRLISICFWPVMQYCLITTAVAFVLLL